MITKSGCLFCEITKDKIPSYKIYENERFIAILDIFPNIKGQTLVLPKEHVGSYAFDMSDEQLAEFMQFTKQVTRILETRLPVPRVHLVLEGTAIDHLHAKLYPAIGMKNKDDRVVAEEKVKFEKYPGYISTLLGPRASDEELEALQKQLRK